MNTDNLVRALVADAARPVIGIRTHLLAALGIGATLSLLLFRLLFEPRADLGVAIRHHAFATKFGVVTLLAITAIGLLAPIARPLPVRVLPRLGVAPLVLAIAVIAELLTAPVLSWPARVFNANAAHCLASIPLLALPVALCLFVALRRGAPANAGRAGAIAGLAAGGIGASLYALACPADSSLFVALWYSLAIGAMATLGSLAGRRWLRW